LDKKEKLAEASSLFGGVVDMKGTSAKS